MDTSETDRRVIVNRLKEHLAGPMSDEMRVQVEAVVKAEEKRVAQRPWHRKFIDGLRS
jgi:hypothetical protein